MKQNFDVDKFFKPLRLEHPVSEVDYAKVLPYIESLSALTRVANMSLYVIDYHKKGFLYVSSNPLFLCGYEQKEVRELGYNFYPKVVPPEDMVMLLEINEKGFEYFYQQEQNSKTRYGVFISYDFTMCHKNGQKFKVNHKLTPFALTPDGDMWLSLCIVTLSIQEKSGNAYIQQFNSLDRLEYSFKTKRWSVVPAIVLTDREKEILRLSAQGYTEQNIANKIFVEKSTVKFHKNNILSKLGVNNIMEAVYYSSVNQMI